MAIDKGHDLNKRVWTLFQRAGCETRPNSDDPAEHLITLPVGKQRPVDLLARAADLGVVIVGSNKARSKLHSFTAHIHDLEKLVAAEKASCALFVASEKGMKETERTFARQCGVSVWDASQLSYYEALVDAIGDYAKYEIIHALGLSTAEEKHQVSVLAIRLDQPRSSSAGRSEMYVFAASADWLLKTCHVLRRAQGNAYAYQRILSRKRLPKIAEFLGTPDALLPTNIVLHLGDSVTVVDLPNDFKDGGGSKITLARPDHKLVALTFPLTYGSLELIDGQHRLFGFVRTSDETRKHFGLVVLALRNLDEKRRSSTFVAINDKARRVDPNLVSLLRYTDDEKICQSNPDLMAIKIVFELNKLSPFADAIRLLDVGHQRLTLKGLSGYDLRGLVSSKGLLRQYYPNNQSSDYIRALRIYFSVIREEFPNEWANPGAYIIATNRGVTAFLKLLRSILNADKKPVAKESAKKYIVALRKHWSGTWETARLRSTYVGSQGWKRFHQDMVKSIRRGYKTFEE